MLSINKIHHVAIICSDYERSKDFYTRILGFKIIREVFREERNSYKLDLDVDGHVQIELFSFENPPERVSRPEARGLRHLAFEVKDIEKAVKQLKSQGVEVEELRTDPYTGKWFTFFADPDDLPLELYER
jgi:glyoxylase I family protein